MITCISYGDRKYRDTAKVNLESAKLHGADNTILYGPEKLPLSFKLKNWRVYFARSGKRLRWRGAGFWVWKPYVILQTLKQMKDGDYLIYSDGGSVYVNNIYSLIDTMKRENSSVLVFSLSLIEKIYTKRDAFILLNADEPKYTDTNQRIGGYIVLKKNDESISFVEEWLSACCDFRMITDSRNRMGKDNYPEFIDHRHDQSLLSLISKKHGIKEYRDPSQWGNDESKWTKDVLERSTYPQIWYSTRDRNIRSMEDFNRKVPNPFIIPE